MPSCLSGLVCAVLPSTPWVRLLVTEADSTRGHGFPSLGNTVQLSASWWGKKGNVARLWVRLMKPVYIPPVLNGEAFNCPRCHVYADQKWYYLQASSQADGLGAGYTDREFRVSRCRKCGETTIWLGEKMVFPINATAEPPNADLPDEIAADYEEARMIASLSPRGAAALLRLCIQKLCKHLGQSGQNINGDIAELVKTGLPSGVQKALDSVRVIGNESVHPGTIDLHDNPETVSRLFKLVNFIADKMLTEQRELDEIYDGLPQDKRDAIARRDASGQGAN